MKTDQRYASFYSGSKRLRMEFESVFRDERASDPRRFCFEPWSVPGQYYQLRTPAYSFFSEKNYMPFHHRLVEFGRSVLGCHDVSPPWLSLYLDGHFQELHCDAPHGPWAFVYSLTPDAFSKANRGGHTQILNPKVLDFSQPGRLLETDHVVRSIKPRYNQLLVFDGRFAHRVSRVRDVFHPCDGRLVIHGWFLNPRPFVSGPQPVGVLAKQLQAFEKFLHQHEIAPTQPGVFNFRLDVSSRGEVKRCQFLASTLYEADRALIANAVRRFWKKTQWKPTRKPSQLFIPLSWGG